MVRGPDRAFAGALHLAGKLHAGDWKDREDVQFPIDDGTVAGRVEE